MSFQKNLLDFLSSFELPAWLLPIKIIFILISVLLLGGIIYFAIFTDYFYYRFFEALDDWYEFKKRQREKKKSEAEKRQIPKEAIKLSPWEVISSKMKEEREMGLKIALIDADRLLNQKLEELKIEGRNVKEKLKNLSLKIIPNLAELKEARQCLEEVLEEKEVSKERIKKAIKIYQEAYHFLEKS